MPVKSGAAARRRAANGPSEAAVRRLWEAYWSRPGARTRNQLVVLYQPVVAEIVRRFASRLPRRIDRGDLDTAANVGLMAAIAGFDPDRGVRFESYCERRIKGALLDELRHQDWLPRPWRRRIELHKRALERLRAETNREPLDEEVAREMELSLEEYQHLFGTGLPDAPAGAMSATDGGDEYSETLEDVLADTRNDPPGYTLNLEELLRLVAQRLTEQEYRIVYLKYWEELSMREIGQLTGLSESRVCKIHSRLLDRLKDRFRVGR